MFNDNELYIHYTPSTARELFIKYRQEGKELKVTIEDIIKEHNRSWLVQLKPEHTPDVIKAIQEDDTWLGDFELKDGYLQAIKYEPYTCLFTTSGKIIVENDLLDFFEDVDFDINTTKGIIQTLDFYSQRGMLHGFVGNSCPGLYLNKELGSIHIGVDYDQESEDYIIPDGFKQVTSICTDLWWYSIMDVEVMKELDKDFDKHQWNIIEIPAGTWKLTHKYGVSERGYHENLPYATLELIK